MACLVCRSDGPSICDSCLSDVSAACPLVWLRGRPGLALIDIILRDSLANPKGGFSSPPSFRSFMEYVAKDMDDLRVEGVFAHLGSLSSAETDGDMELLELALQLSEGAEMMPEISKTMMSSLKRSRSRSPGNVSSEEIDASLSMLQAEGSMPKDSDARIERRGRAREEVPIEDGGIEPETSLPPGEDVQGLIMMAQHEASSGSTDAAIQICDQVLNTYPDNVDAILVMCFALAKEDPATAVEMAEDAMGLEDSSRTRFAHAYAQYRSGAPWGKIVQDLVGSRIWKDEEQAWHVLLGEAYLKGGKKDKAIEEFNSALMGGDEKTALMRLNQMGSMSVDPMRLREARESLGGVAWVRT